jgi:hypothetical protein
MTNLPPLNGISTQRFGRTGEDVGMGCLQLIFTLRSSFLLGMVAPLDLAKTDYSVSGPALHGVQNLHRLLHRGQVFPDIDLLCDSLLCR